MNQDDLKRITSVIDKHRREVEAGAVTAETEEDLSKAAVEFAGAEGGEAISRVTRTISLLTEKPSTDVDVDKLSAPALMDRYIHLLVSLDKNSGIDVFNAMIVVGNRMAGPGGYHLTPADLDALMDERLGLVVPLMRTLVIHEHVRFARFMTETKKKRG